MINLKLSTNQVFILKDILDKHITIYGHVGRTELRDIITKINDISITTNEQTQSDDKGVE